MQRIFQLKQIISLDNNDSSSIFENEVVVKTKDKVIYSDFAKYNKKKDY